MDTMKLRNEIVNITKEIKTNDYRGVKAKEELTNNTTLEFYSVVDSIRSKITLGSQNEYEVKFLGSLSIAYNNYQNTDYYAYALASKEEFDIEFDKQNLIVFNAELMYSNKKTIIHEIAHIIIDKFCPSSQIHNGYHCLEFAIITYCLDWFIDQRVKKYNSTFFRSYDIHEDIAYPNIAINPCKFDSLIKTIEWNSIEDLAQQATRLAKKIRSKSLL